MGIGVCRHFGAEKEQGFGEFGQEFWTTKEEALLGEGKEGHLCQFLQFIVESFILS